jgi:hypothetical protein
MVVQNMKRRWTAGCVITGLLTSSLLSGCGAAAPHSQKVSGSVVAKVTFGGEPIKEGVISLVNNQTGLGGGGPLGSDGTTSIRMVPVGQYVVTVTPPSLIGSDPNPEARDFPNLPGKFRSEATSTLKAEVKQGSNRLEFDLKE